MIYDLQKPLFWKRISAWMFDAIIMMILIAGFATVISSAVGYDQKLDKLEGYYHEYSEKYGINFDITAEEYEKLSDAEKQHYIDTDEIFKQDKRVVGTYNLIYNLTLIIIAIGVLLSVIIWEFIVPLFLKNGQTVGKKIFGIAVIRTNGVKASSIQLFIRAILGKYTFELMLPIFSLILFFFAKAGIFAVGMIGLVLIAQLVSLIATRRTRSALHDLLADTVTVDLASQLIFDSEEEMIKYKEEQHAKMAERSPY